jgi:hypothetical protein
LHAPRSEERFHGGKRLIEIVVNGKTVASAEIVADGQPHDLEFEIPIEQSSWVALRQFPQLHTNPVNVLVSGKPIRASRQSAWWCVETIDQLWRNRERSIVEPERADARVAFESAKQTLRKIAEECGGD